jgi:hypothetical protein
LISSEGYDCTAQSNLDEADLLGNGLWCPQPLTVFNRSMVSMLLANAQCIRLCILHLVSAPSVALTHQNPVNSTKELYDIDYTNHVHMQSLAASSTKATDFYIKILDICTRCFLLALHTPFANQIEANPCYYYSHKVRIEAVTLPLPRSSLYPGLIDGTIENDFLIDRD